MFSFLKNPAKKNTVDYSIDIVNLNKEFKRSTLRRGSYSTIKSLFASATKTASQKITEQYSVTQAVQGITMRVPSGSSLGVIGRNGAGKSTLLKLITGIYKPTSGSVVINGRVAALIELGAGFHPDFSGRENISLSGIMYGMTTSEVADAFDEIVDFAELRSVIDDPVRTYSSGMFMRLGFSVAIHSNPDVLLIDEILSVGDAAFIHKCRDKLTELRGAGKTMLIVSHDLDSISRWCDEVVWLNEGSIKDRGEPRRVIDSYLHWIEKGEEVELRRTILGSDENLDNLNHPSQQQTEERWGSREVEILSIRMLNSNGEERQLFHTDDSVTIELTYNINEKVEDLIFGVGIRRIDGLQVFGSNTQIDQVSFPINHEGSGMVKIKIERLGLIESTYHLDLAAHRSDGYPYDYRKSGITFLVRSLHERIGVMAPKYSWEFF